MNHRQMQRALRKELLRLQAEQHRQGLADACQLFRQSVAGVGGSESPAESWTERVQFLLSMVLPQRWRKVLIYGVMLKKLLHLWRNSPSSPQ